MELDVADAVGQQLVSMTVSKTNAAMQSPLSTGHLRKGSILCPLHGARFDVKTGEHLGPPATRGIETFEVRVADGVVEAAVTETRRLTPAHG